MSLNTRPDISPSVIILAQKVSKPSQYDWNELKRVVRYLKGTKTLKLQMANNDNDDLIGYADANWGESRADRKSISGYFFKLNGGFISWCSKKQTCVALSSTEAEVIAFTAATKEAVWLRRFLNEIYKEIKNATIIYEDNQSCQKLISNGLCSARTKHIDIRSYFVKDYIERNEIICSYCPSENMIADILTKPLNRVKFEKFRDLLGLHD